MERTHLFAILGIITLDVLYQQDFLVPEFLINVTYCQADSECELVDTDCCNQGCAPMAAINKNYKEYWLRQKTENCKGHSGICLAMLCSIEPRLDPVAKCSLNNRCVIASKNLDILVLSVNSSAHTVTLKNSGSYAIDVDSVRWIEDGWAQSIKADNCPERVIESQSTFVCKITDCNPNETIYIGTSK